MIGVEIGKPRRYAGVCSFSMGPMAMGNGISFIAIGVLMWMFGTGRIGAKTTEEGSRQFVERYGRFFRIFGWAEVIFGFVLIIVGAD